MTAKTEDAPKLETDRIDPEPEDTVTLSSGSVVRLQPLKTRQFFRMLRIITRGGAHVLGNVDWGSMGSDEEFAQQMMALLVFAVPEAEQEAIEFIQAMVEPESLSGDREKDAQAFDLLYAELDNPELEDTIAILGAVIQAEASDLKALGKRLRMMMGVAEKTGQLKTDEKKTPKKKAS